MWIFQDVVDNDGKFVIDHWYRQYSTSCNVETNDESFLKVKQDSVGIFLSWLETFVSSLGFGNSKRILQTSS